ncbi:MAG: bifunctional riboflavin kinase/FAD synthetase [Deltaproteobacteria bacterium]|nr:bifunctional riboflavin kinase/FAD synthetase [Deltaproteobacteria bacterium]
MIHDLAELQSPLRNPVLTIGNFDGVHRGHLALFERVKIRARAIGGVSVVMTFQPHPLKIMKPEKAPPLITPTQQKLALIAQSGIHTILCLQFDETFAAISAEDFVQDILVEKIGVKELVVGYDYTFGHNRTGNIELLRVMGKNLGFQVHVVQPVLMGKRVVSSTSIRELIRAGELAKAKKLLGRDYQICGTVVKGKNRGGRLLGFPTANLEVVDELTPKEGVYAVKVLIDDHIYNGVTNIGHNPTFGQGPLSIETHILDYSGNLLGQTIRVNFIERLRVEKTYKSIEELARQIDLDVKVAREVLESQ